VSSKLPPVLPDAVVELFDSMALVDAPYRGLPELILEQPGGNGPESTLICNAFYLTLPTSPGRRRTRWRCGMLPRTVARLR
jgi:hypothetical protein